MSGMVDALLETGGGTGVIASDMEPESPFEAYRIDFEEASAVSKDPVWLREARRDAFGLFERVGFPTMKD